jgi:predicted peroxiredoxin
MVLSGVNLSKKVIVAMDGVGGTISMPLSLKMAMKMARTDHDVRVFFWTHGVWQPIKDLTDRAHIEKKAAELHALLASLIEDGAQVQLVAKSGGSIVAIKALEKLPEGSVGSVVLLSPAISPGYDLGPALKAVSGNLHCFYSRYDRFYLQLGTTLFGTSDGVKGPSAGLIGFKTPAEKEQVSAHDHHYAKLRQTPWTPHMLRHLHIGLHLGNSLLPWLMSYVVPVLRGGGAPSEQAAVLAPVSERF